MDRCVVLVDAGYLLGAAASLLAGESSRSRIEVDHGELIRRLRERAERETGLPLLRIYWFDAAYERRPTPDHRRLRVLPRVTVRLGALTRADGRWVQKGVDAAMHAELSELARNRACADVVLVTGDGDLLPGMTAAKDYGVAVHLWAVQAADGDFNQSEDLVAEADERRVLDREWITGAIAVRDQSAACPPAVPTHEIAKILAAPAPEGGTTPNTGSAPPRAAAATAPAETEPVHESPRPLPGPTPHAGAGPVRPGPAAPVRTAPASPPTANPAPTPAPGPRPAVAAVYADPGAASGRPGGEPRIPTPKEIAAGMARPAAVPLPGPTPHAPSPSSSPSPSTLRWSSDKGWVDRGAAEQPCAGDSLPTLTMLTTAEQKWADREDDITSVGGDPAEVGQVFARRWVQRLADPARLALLLPDYPRVPHRLDAELLRYAARFGLLSHKDDQIDEHDRYAIRAGFWREVAAAL